jgi:thiol-disulfide isomerase/thioredoxin
MRPRQKAVIVALGLLLLPERPAAAQMTIEPASPRWGERVTITAEPNSAAPESDRFDASDRLFAVLSTFEHGTAGAHRLWTPMTWDGRRFVAHVTLPQGCEAAYAGVATAERVFGNARRLFVCRTSEGTLPPGALIEGLVWGGRDRSSWQADVAADVAALRPTADHGWEYSVLWLYRREYDRVAFTREEFLRDVERADREETGRTAGLLSSLVYGYDGAGETAKAFDRLKELCDRFPESEHTPRGLYFASAAVVNHPEFDAELNRLLAQVAVRAPENTGLRGSMFRLVTKTSGVPLAIIRGIATRWVRDDPADMQPHYLLAVALSNASGLPDQQVEAEALASEAIELAMRPHPYDFAEQRSRQMAFALRSRLRAARGDLVGAVADARMAQLVARDKAAADDMSAEADLWQRLGFGRKAEDLAWEAYRLGSLKAETLLKSAYVARTGGDAGFSDYLIARLRERGASAVAALRPTPAFSATTLDGVKVESSMLKDRITVLDFWFINCPPCRVERPKLNEIVSEFGDKVRFVGFALDSSEALKTYLASNPYKYEVVPRSKEIADAFGVNSFPQHMVIDRSGKIVWLSGSDDDRIERLRAVIFRVLASQPARPE